MKLEELSNERLREEKRKIEAELSKRHETFVDECYAIKADKKQLLDKLSKESLMVLTTAYVYAKNLVDYGVDITKVWSTAVQQSFVIQEVRTKVYAKAYDSFKKDYETHLKKDSSWIKCSDDNLPDLDVDVLGTTKEDGDVVKVTRQRTCLEECGWEWWLTDDVSGTRYKHDEIIAWMPLPEGFKEENNG